MDHVENVNEAYYQNNNIDYERQTSDEKLEFYMSLVRKWIPKGQPIFELGVGMGHFLQSASSEYRCGGCDVNRFGVQCARSKLQGLLVEEGSYECIPTNPEQAAIVSWDVLEHLPDLKEGLAAIYSKLPAGGFLIAVVPVYDGPLGWLVRLLDRDPTHVSKLGRWEWLQLLKEHGFQEREYGGILRKLVGTKYIHITGPQAILRYCRNALYFVVQK